MKQETDREGSAEPLIFVKTGGLWGTMKKCC